MANTTSIIAPASKFSYFNFPTGQENGGYSLSYENNGKMYIGQKSTSGDNSGVNCGSFGILLYNIPNKNEITKITSIDFSIFTTRDPNGYNDCEARIEYIGTSYNAYPGIWRVGTSSEKISLIEPGSGEPPVECHLTTSDITTCSNFLNLIQSAVSGQYYYFRIVRESGMGILLKTDITLTINYETGNKRIAKTYVYTTNRSLIQCPSAAMTSNNSQGCVVTASSTYSSTYPAWRCFDKSYYLEPWASKSTDTAPYIAIQLNKSLYDIKLRIYNRNDRSDNIRGPISGFIRLTNDTSFETISASKIFSDRDGEGVGTSSTIELNNSIAYKCIKIEITDWAGYAGSSKTYCAIGEIEIEGYELPSKGGWVEATPYVYNGSSWNQVLLPYVFI